MNHGRALSDVALTYSIAGHDLIKFVADPYIDISRSVRFEQPVQLATTFLTTVWITVFLLGLLVLRLCEHLGGGIWKWLRDTLLDIDTKPVLSLGWICASIVLILFLVATPIFVQPSTQM